MVQDNGKKPIYPILPQVNSIRDACQIAITDLYEAGRPDLTVPFACILAELAAVDVKALAQLDAERVK